ncbi:uncharacterized protein LOC128207899 [Mya arenaria]|uniref:uncharacterized protein LOC128207899 n=1 Tax=Mya arenaria TaxID=6604 RepID=UPI0022E42CAF|nr:uncharacterized protein LOC128207899 [Mya arenaria]
MSTDAAWFLPERRGDVAPPSNNACIPDIFNKLDASSMERTRVLNSQLDMRLHVQERKLLQYRTAAEHRFQVERDKLKNVLRNIPRRLPNYSDIPQLETKVHKLKQSQRRRGQPSNKHDCVFTTTPMDMKGLADDTQGRAFCGRFFSHHFHQHLPVKTRRPR